MNIWPIFDDKMLEGVNKVLSSGKVNQWTSPEVKNFENKFSKMIGCNYSVAVFNGTVALELCLKTLNLKKEMK